MVVSRSWLGENKQLLFNGHIGLVMHDEVSSRDWLYNIKLIVDTTL